MLSLYSLMCYSLTPLAMLMASFAPTSPRNVALTISRVVSSTALSDALSASESASSAIVIQVFRSCALSSRLLRMSLAYSSFSDR